MKKTLIILSIFAVIAIIVGSILTGTVISSLNGETTLKMKVTSQQKNCEVVFDNTWKIISQQCQISDKYKDSFKEIYPALMQGRYGKGDGSLMKWVTEANPTFDTKLFEKVMSSIELQRNTFTAEQKKLIDFNREHDIMLEKIPMGLIMTALGREKIVIKLVTSTKTEKAFETGKDDDIKL